MQSEKILEQLSSARTPVAPPCWGLASEVEAKGLEEHPLSGFISVGAHSQAPVITEHPL